MKLERPVLAIDVCKAYLQAVIQCINEGELESAQENLERAATELSLAIGQGTIPYDLRLVREPDGRLTWEESP